MKDDMIVCNYALGLHRISDTDKIRRCTLSFHTVGLNKVVTDNNDDESPQ